MNFISGGGVGELGVAIPFCGGFISRLFSHRKIAAEADGKPVRTGGYGAGTALFRHSGSNQGPNQEGPNRGSGLAGFISVVHRIIHLVDFLVLLHDVVSLAGSEPNRGVFSGKTGGDEAEKETG